MGGRKFRRKLEAPWAQAKTWLDRSQALRLEAVDPRLNPGQYCRWAPTKTERVGRASQSSRAWAVTGLRQLSCQATTWPF